jgi:fibronectin-binding autotransporter adhesin
MACDAAMPSRRDVAIHLGPAGKWRSRWIATSRRDGAFHAALPPLPLLLLFSEMRPTRNRRLLDIQPPILQHLQMGNLLSSFNLQTNGPKGQRQIPDNQRGGDIQPAGPHRRAQSLRPSKLQYWETQALFLRLRFRFAVVLAGMAAVLGVPGALQAGDSSWKGATGSWADGSNWSGGVPGAGSNAYIANWGTATLAAGVAGTSFAVYLGNGAGTLGAIDINGGSLNADAMFIAFNNNSDGILDISSGSLFCRELSAGSEGLAFFTQTGGTVTTEKLWFGYSGSSIAQAAVRGGTLATDELWIGQGGYACLRLENSAKITSDTWSSLGVLENSEGEAIMTGGEWTSSNLTIGQDGKGKLTMSGGVLSQRSTSIGSSWRGSGEATLSGGEWKNSSDLTVGGFGDGTLTISGGQMTSNKATIGFTRDATGTVRVTDGTWSNPSSLIVGRAGTGTLEVSGGDVSSGGAQLGYASNSTGVVKVSGGKWTTSGQIHIGSRGTGTLQISGGTVADTSGLIAVEPGSTGNATLSGGTWENSQDFVSGYGGTGTFAMSGGTLINHGKAAVGYNANSHGTVTMTDGTWTSTESLQIGSSGTGIFNLEGGTLSASLGVLGFSATGSGTATVTGGNWSQTGNLYVGSSGSGTLNLDGGTISDSQGILGLASGSVGNVKVTNGTWNNSNYLNVGLGGTGTLTVEGGTVSSLATYVGIEAGSTGEVLLKGGTLRTVGIVGGAGTASLVFDGGTLQAVANQSNFVGGFADGNATIGSGGAFLDSNGYTVTATSSFSGAGGLTKRGPGTLILAGNNTYGGATTIEAGKLQIGNGGTAGSIAGNVANNGTLAFNRSDDITFDGDISGSGALENSGAGTVILTGTNTHAGGTTITAGTLQLGNGGTTGSIAGDVVNNGLFAFNRSDDFTFGGAISGSGAVRQAGAGKVSIATANTYSGGTTIQSGTVQTSHASALGTGGAILNGGTLDPVGRLDLASLTWNGGTVASVLGTATDLIALTGNLTVNPGGGTFAFSDGAGFAPNTKFTILTAANPDSAFLALLSGNQLLGLNPVFSFENGSLLVNYVGATSGPRLDNRAPVYTPIDADFRVQGAVQTGGARDNTVRSLAFDNGGALRVFGTLHVTSGHFDVASGSGTISGGRVAVPGNFLKTGGGALLANSDFLVGGAGAVTGGAVYVNGRFTVPGGLTVFQNALLGGNGTIVGNLFNAGTLAPGSSPGTLTITGNYTQSSTGTFALEIASPSVFDRLIVGGTAGLDGTLHVLNLGRKLRYGQQYAFLRAARINGDFDRILMPQPSRFRGRFLAEDGLGTLVVAPASYTLVAKTDNQRRVARALDGFIPARSGDRNTVSTALDIQSEDQYPAAFDRIAPGFYESLTEITLNQAFAQTQMLNQRLTSVRLGARGFQSIGLGEQPLAHDRDGSPTADPKDLKTLIQLPPSRNWSAWAMGTGIFAKAVDTGSVPNYRYEAGGFLAGADYAFGGRTCEPGCPAFTAGAYGGTNFTSARYADGSRTTVNSALFGVYGTYTQGGFYADAVVGGGYSAFRSRRSIQFSTIDRTARSTPDGGQFSSAINLGYDWHAGGFTFGPIGGVQYTYAGVAAFTEEGAESLDLHLGQQNANSMMMTLGGRVACTCNITPKFCLIPEVRIFWQHEFLNNPRLIGAALDGGTGPGFNYETAAPDRDSVFAGAGITARFGNNLNAFFYYNADFARSDFLSHAVSTGIGIRF